jgi:hypothetical protein
LITTTGDRFARLRDTSRRDGSRLRRAASPESRPGTLVMSIEPGLNPSARFMSVGSMWTPARFAGIDSRFRSSRLPVGVSRSVVVKRSFGQG